MPIKRRLAHHVHRHLIEHWTRTRWLLLVAAVLSGGEVALPIFEPMVGLRYRASFAIAVFVLIVAAFIARYVAQKKLGAQ